MSDRATGDGRIDFSQYSAQQLEELRFSLDGERFPLNFANLVAELERREGGRPSQTEAPVSMDGPVPGRFTTRDGIRGWIQANGSRSPVYGRGAIDVRDSEIVLLGGQRNWLGAPEEAQVSMPFDRVRNVVAEGCTVHFEFVARWRPRRHVQFMTETVQRAQQLIARLPTSQTKGFEQRWSALRAFHRQLQEVSPRAWVTPALVALNVAVFAAMAIPAKRLGDFDPVQLMAWGANFGPLTVSGQWWRLLTAVFVHFNLLHLLLNMWALWNAGRFTERLYGRGVFIALYLGSGVFGSLASIAWDPSHSSVGASGAIFGVLGAFLAFLTHRRTQIPSSMFWSYGFSTLAFVLFNLFSGATQNGIDNAAHVGGLLSGFVFGWLLARPLTLEAREEFPLERSLGAAVLAGGFVSLALWQVLGIGSEMTVPEQYMRSHEWYATGERSTLLLWQELATAASKGTMSDPEIGARFERDILPFWKTAQTRLKKEAGSVPARQKTFAALMAEFVHLRLEWTLALIDATKNRDTARARESVRLSQETDLVQARLDRAALRALLDHRGRALATTAPVLHLRELLSGKPFKCVESRTSALPPLAPTDERTDAPAVRWDAACDAQRLFLARDYHKLDSRLKQATMSLGDLTDGGSSVGAMYAGLSTLFEYGGLSFEEVMARTADWRRTIPGSLEAELVEVEALQEWAWSARGNGSAYQVTPQGFALFGHRSEMAAEGLREIATKAVTNPVWYKLSVDVGLDQSLEVGQLRAVFDRGQARFPQYGPLYHSMLRALMPRWLGSREQVRGFIDEMAAKAGRQQAFERYAMLYWAYANLERGDVDIFSDGLATWPSMKFGFKDMLERHPKSDLVLNGFAYFACRANDAAGYRNLRPLVAKRLSATAWPASFSLKICDQRFSATKISPPPPEGAGVDDKVAEGQRALFKEDWTAAEAIARDLVAAYPKRSEGYLLAAEVEERSGQYEAASASFQDAVKVAPDNARAWYGLANLSMHRNQNRESLAAFDHALELDPRLWEAWADRSIVQDALGDRKGAIKSAQKACDNGVSMACKMVRDYAP